MSIIGIFAPSNNLTLKRVTAAVAYVDGMAQAATRTTAYFTGSVQPITGIELENLPELQRTKDPRLVFTTTLLKTVDKTNKTMADVVVYGGNEYIVDKVEPYSEWLGVGLQHYKVRILRKDE